MAKRYRLSDICKAIVADPKTSANQKGYAKYVLDDIETSPLDSFEDRAVAIKLSLGLALGILPPPNGISAWVSPTHSTDALAAKALELAKHYNIEMVEAEP